MVKRKKQVKRPKRRFFKKRVCMFCTEKIEEIDYKDVARLSRFITERGKMSSRRGSGVCARHQRKLACAIKRARCIALMPFVKK
ncbi:MAG: 30S ribosomal protein S18 [Candidatus Omnitrophica bacterium]|nr:30S ribosomal protein S18 [Candidatus Omnitrophota bacterium]MBU3933714.1 30S ribosomal protein S18 [Candidatus Omnitrophota bacterium]MBU4140674.1 30S ribosomal protein S18 [Candidatus Omnitrophota bacterium]